jgi:hypothetical protein
MTLLPDTPLSISQIFMRSARLWKPVFKNVFPLVFIAFIFFILPYFIFPELNSVNMADRVGKWFSMGFTLILYWVISIVFYTAIYHHVFKFLQAETEKFWASIWVGIKKFLLISFAVLLAALLTGLGYVALAIPGIYLTVVFAIYLPLLITENLNPFNALKSSIELIWLNWWRTAIIVGIPSFLFMLVNLAIEIYALRWLTIPHPLGGEILLFHHISKFILAIFYFPFFVTLVLVQVNDLKLRKSSVSAAANLATAS